MPGRDPHGESVRANQKTWSGLWLARGAIGCVFALNVSCALFFLLQPDRYAGAFELGGLPGTVVVQSFGILFLTWNSTYPVVLKEPFKQQTLFSIILIPQVIGLAGETCLWLRLPAGHAIFLHSGQRFIVFDGAGLMVMLTVYLLLHGRSPGSRSGVTEVQMAKKNEN